MIDIEKMIEELNSYDLTNQHIELILIDKEDVEEAIDPIVEISYNDLENFTVKNGFYFYTYDIKNYKSFEFREIND